MLLAASLVVGVAGLGRSASLASDLDDVESALTQAQSDLAALEKNLRAVAGRDSIVLRPGHGFQDQLAGLAPGVAAGIGEAIEGLDTFAASTLEFQVPISEDLPINTTLDLNRTITVPIQTTIPINETVETTITIAGPFGVDIPLDVTVPIQLDLPVDLDVAFTINEQIPIATNVPIDLQLPISIDIADTELATLVASLRVGLSSMAGHTERTQLKRLRRRSRILDPGSWTRPPRPQPSASATSPGSRESTSNGQCPPSRLQIRGPPVRQRGEAEAIRGPRSKSEAEPSDPGPKGRCERSRPEGPLCQYVAEDCQRLRHRSVEHPSAALLPIYQAGFEEHLQVMTYGWLGHSERINQVAGTCLVFCCNQGEQPEAGWIGQDLEPSREEVCLFLRGGEFRARGRSIVRSLACLHIDTDQCLVHDSALARSTGKTPRAGTAALRPDHVAPHLCSLAGDVGNRHDVPATMMGFGPGFGRCGIDEEVHLGTPFVDNIGPVVAPEDEHRSSSGRYPSTKSITIRSPVSGSMDVTVPSASRAPRIPMASRAHHVNRVRPSISTRCRVGTTLSPAMPMRSPRSSSRARPSATASASRASTAISETPDAVATSMGGTGRPSSRRSANPADRTSAISGEIQRESISATPSGVRSSARQQSPTTLPAAISEQQSTERERSDCGMCCLYIDVLRCYASIEEHRSIPSGELWPNNDK